MQQAIPLARYPGHADSQSGEPTRRRSRLPWLVLLAALLLLPVAVVWLPGFILDTPQGDPTRHDAIVVISGDEQLARFREGLRLFRGGLARYLVFSGAAEDLGTSNAEAMRRLAVDAGIPPSQILIDPKGANTWGNAVYTRQLLLGNGLHSALLVTSPYHARRAKWTFDAAYQGSGIQLDVHSAPDGEWRKLSWWRQPETRRLTMGELERLAYIAVTGKYE